MYYKLGFRMIKTCYQMFVFSGDIGLKLIINNLIVWIQDCKHLVIQHWETKIPEMKCSYKINNCRHKNVKFVWCVDFLQSHMQLMLIKQLIYGINRMLQLEGWVQFKTYINNIAHAFFNYMQRIATQLCKV